MARPIKSRIICSIPKVNTFGPKECPKCEIITMTLEEFEAIRLIDYNNLTQEEASAFMEIARTTIQSIYEAARKKISDALVNGKKIIIEGGNYSLCNVMPMGKKCNRKTCQRFNNKFLKE